MRESAAQSQVQRLALRWADLSYARGHCTQGEDAGGFRADEGAVGLPNSEGQGDAWSHALLLSGMGWMLCGVRQQRHPRSGDIPLS
mmetsp:Transcript_62236/g.144808  ORF Transcript_62236/g.144808 Transcript_62236/m.144808 type:complete len:86 (-) Transcript_62236:396-653(-)